MSTLEIMLVVFYGTVDLLVAKRPYFVHILMEAGVKMAAVEMMLVVFYSLVATVVSEDCTRTIYTGAFLNQRQTETFSCPLGCCGLTEEEYCCVSRPAIVGFAFGSFVLFIILIFCVICCLNKAGICKTTTRNRVTGTTQLFIQHTNGPVPPHQLNISTSAPAPYSSTANPTYAYGNYSTPLNDGTLTATQYPAPAAPAYSTGPLSSAYGQAYP